MGRMIRKQVYIEEEQEALLKQRACELGVTESWLIRQGIDRMVGIPVRRYRDRQSWQEELAFMRSRQALVTDEPAPKSRGWTREELYAERLDRFSR